MTEWKTRENRLRLMARRQGLELKRNPRRDFRAVDYGSYKLLDARTAVMVADFGWDKPGNGTPGSTHLDDVEAYLKGKRAIMDDETGYPPSARIIGDGLQMASADAVQGDFGRYLDAARRGVHTEITRWDDAEDDEVSPAVLVPCEWHDQLIQLLRALRQAQAGWGDVIPVEKLREIAKLAASMLPPVVDYETAGEMEVEAQAVRGPDSTAYAQRPRSGSVRGPVWTGTSHKRYREGDQ